MPGPGRQSRRDRPGRVDPRARRNRARPGGALLYRRGLPDPGDRRRGPPGAGRYVRAAGSPAPAHGSQRRSAGGVGADRVGAHHQRLHPDGVGVSATYHAGSRELQDRFDTRRLADRLDERYVSRRTIDADDRAFIERMDMFFLATADADGHPQCSYKGGDPGFVRVLDECTLAFPNYDGNGMYLSMGNVLQNGAVGM